MPRVMIVEDQRMVRTLLESYIRSEPGYTLAVSIPGAAEAPALCDTEDIDLVLMDVQTEHRENGLAAAEKIRKAHPEIKIVVWWWSWQRSRHFLPERCERRKLSPKHGLFAQDMVY